MFWKKKTEIEPHVRSLDMSTLLFYFNENSTANYWCTILARQKPNTDTKYLLMARKRVEFVRSIEPEIINILIFKVEFERPALDSTESLKLGKKYFRR